MLTVVLGAIGFFFTSLPAAFGVNSQSQALLLLGAALASLAICVWNGLPNWSAFTRIIAFAVAGALVLSVGWPRNGGTVTLSSIAVSAVHKRQIEADAQFWNNTRFSSSVSVYKGSLLISKVDQNIASDVASAKNQAQVFAAQDEHDASFTVNPGEKHGFSITSGPLPASQYVGFKNGDFVFYVAEILIIKGDIWPTRRTFCWYNTGNRHISTPC